MAGSMDWGGQTTGRGGGGCGNSRVQVTTHLPSPSTYSDQSEPGLNVEAEEGGGLPPSPAGYQDSCESWLASAWVGGHHQVEPKAYSPTKQEWSGALKEFESSICDIEEGLQRIARKLETKATHIAVAMKDLQWVWDELDCWHQRMALLEAAMQDYEGQHPERAPGLGEAAFTLAQLYNVLRSQAERRTAKLRRAESLMEQYESRRRFVLKWVEKAQAVDADDIGAHQALLEQSSEVLAGLEAMVECVDALSEACSVERLVQQVSELDQRTTTQHGTLQARLRRLCGPSKDELAAMEAEFQLLESQLSSPALNACGQAPQLALRRRLLDKLSTLAEQVARLPRAGTCSVLREAIVHLQDVTEQQCAALQAALAKAEWRAGETRRLQTLAAEAEEELWILGASKHGDAPRVGVRKLALARRIRGYWECIAGLTAKGDLVRRRSRHPATMRKSGPPLTLPPLVEAEEEWENGNCGMVHPAGCGSPSANADDASLDRDIGFFQALTPEALLAAVERIVQERGGEVAPELVDASQAAADVPSPPPLAAPPPIPKENRGSEEEDFANTETPPLDFTAAAAVAASNPLTAPMVEADNVGVLPELANGGALIISRCVKQAIRDNSPTRTAPSPSGARDRPTQFDARPPPKALADACKANSDLEPAFADSGADVATSVEQRAASKGTGVRRQAETPAPSDILDGEPKRGDAGLRDDAGAAETNDAKDLGPHRAPAAAPTAAAAAAEGKCTAEAEGSPPGPLALARMCEDFEGWLARLEHRVSARDSVRRLELPQSRDELNTFVAVQHEVQQGLTRLEELKVRHRQLLCSGDPGTVAMQRPRVQACNHRWVGLKKVVATIIKTLRRSVAQWEEFEGACKDLMVWLTETDLRLTNLERFGECEAQARSDQLRAFQEELSKRQETLNSLRKQAERLGEVGPAGHRLEEALKYFTETSVRVTRYLGRSANISMPPDSGEGEGSPPETSGAAHVTEPRTSGEPNGPGCRQSQILKPERSCRPHETRVSHHHQPPASPLVVISGSVIGDTSLSPLGFRNSPVPGHRNPKAVTPTGDVAGRCRHLTSTPVEDASRKTSEEASGEELLYMGPAEHDCSAEWRRDYELASSRESLASDARTASASEDSQESGASARTLAELSFARESPSSLDWSLRPVHVRKGSPSLSLEWDSYDVRVAPGGELLGENSLGLAPTEAMPSPEKGDAVNSRASGACEQAEKKACRNEGKRICKSTVGDVGVWMDGAEATSHENHLFLRKKESTHISQLQEQGADASCSPSEPSFERTELHDDDDGGGGGDVNLAHLLERGEGPWLGPRRPSPCAAIWWRARSPPWRWRASGWRCPWADICRALWALRSLPRLLVVMLAAAGFLLWAGCISIGGVPRLPPS
uniref:Nesprin-2-like isoform X1 n=1 Tax=Petromyzon marinus TaxID=7757 RepID=A0AAJ7TND1_PETMA|nr:nesprin-2-like isoform X1 [Petromyzon marinus]XP_032819693.1 nesprin-2-like isoform X1 [Petromyzon marinus]